MDHKDTQSQWYILLFRPLTCIVFFVEIVLNVYELHGRAEGVFVFPSLSLKLPFLALKVLQEMY